MIELIRDWLVGITCERTTADAFEQLDLFTDYAGLEREKKRKERELRLQEAVLDIKARYGKNAVLKGTNLLEGATMRERNEQIGGHKA